MSSLAHNTVMRRTTRGPSLTSRQQFTVLDQLLTLALEPLYKESEVFLEWVAEILNNTIKSRRKNASEMMKACGIIMTGAPLAIDLLFASGLDRGQVFRLLERVRRMHKTMLDAEVALATNSGNREEHVRTLHDCHRILGHSARLSPALTTSAYWQDHAVKWRDHIVDHYLKLLLKGAASMNHASGGRVELDPTFQDAWLSACAAVNRFRSDRGPFASFLTRGLKGTYRIAASNALGLAAPGARVASSAALQTTALDNALELEDLTHNHGDADPVVLRALMAIAHDPDVRVTLMISDVSPVEAMHSIGLGPYPLSTPTPAVVKPDSNGLSPEPNKEVI